MDLVKKVVVFFLGGCYLLIDVNYFLFLEKERFVVVGFIIGWLFFVILVFVELVCVIVCLDIFWNEVRLKICIRGVDIVVLVFCVVCCLFLIYRNIWEGLCGLDVVIMGVEILLVDC